MSIEQVKKRKIDMDYCQKVTIYMKQLKIKLYNGKSFFITCDVPTRLVYESCDYTRVQKLIIKSRNYSEHVKYIFETIEEHNKHLNKLVVYNGWFTPSLPNLIYLKHWGSSLNSITTKEMFLFSPRLEYLSIKRDDTMDLKHVHLLENLRRIDILFLSNTKLQNLAKQYNWTFHWLGSHRNKNYIHRVHFAIRYAFARNGIPRDLLQHVPCRLCMGITLQEYNNFLKFVINRKKTA